jgi:hypothetical protein
MTGVNGYISLGMGGKKEDIYEYVPLATRKGALVIVTLRAF